MKAIIDNKLYDTEKAEKLIEFKRSGTKTVECWGALMNLPYRHDITLYKTAKGNYFEVDEVDNVIRVVTEEQVKKLLTNIDPDLYIKLFGEVEEG